MTIGERAGMLKRTHLLGLLSGSEKRAYGELSAAGNRGGKCRKGEMRDPHLPLPIVDASHLSLSSAKEFPESLHEREKPREHQRLGRCWGHEIETGRVRT
jgi:hypothetical protein